MSIRAIHCIAVLGVCTLAACTKGANKQDSVAAMAAESVSKAAAAATPVAPTPPPLTDANILALMDEVNMADSAAGSVAATKGTNAQVKEFGRLMMRDHHSLRKAGMDLAKKQNITPVPPTGDTLPAAAQRMMDNLNSMPKGPDWDKTYITNEVAAHQAVLAILQTAQTATGDTALKALIIKATPTIEAHMKKAQDIAGKLSATASAPGMGETAKAPAETAKKP